MTGEPDVTGTDIDWSTSTGHCGGCGLDDCHDGPCTEEVCKQCPNRWAEGWFCGAGCSHDPVTYACSSYTKRMSS